MNDDEILNLVILGLAGLVIIRLLPLLKAVPVINAVQSFLIKVSDSTDRDVLPDSSFQN